jgi:hypothetical protein
MANLSSTSDFTDCWLQVMNSPVSAGEPAPWADATNGVSILVKAEKLYGKTCAFKSH